MPTPSSFRRQTCKMRVTARPEAGRNSDSMKKQMRVLMVAACGIGVLVWVGAFRPQAAGQAPPAFVAGTESGFATFQTQCAQCHGNPNVDRAPAPTALREMPPEKIYEALTTGTMQQQASALT